MLCQSLAESVGHFWQTIIIQNVANPYLEHLGHLQNSVYLSLTVPIISIGGVLLVIKNKNNLGIIIVIIMYLVIICISKIVIKYIHVFANQLMGIQN